MLIKFKNRMTMALTKMIDDGARLGGIPAHIEVVPVEASEIFSELRKMNPPNYTITSKEGASCKLLIQTKELTDFEFQVYLLKWKQNEWRIEYKKVPIFIVDPQPQTVHLHD